MITKTLQPPSSLFLLILFLTQIPTSSQSNDVAVYWGQNGITNEANLTQTCASAKYSFVIISFLSGFGNFSTPLLNLTTHCGGDPSSSCTQLASQITYCQKQGIKVILSIGGGFGTYNLTSPQDALNLSDYLWNNFLYRNSSSSSSSSQSRPLGGSILDGIDFAIEEFTPYLKDLARDLKSHPNVCLSASPQCLFPDSILASALDTGLFDYVFVKFYNNPSCEFSQANPNPFVNIWNQWVTSLKKAEIFLGLPASPAASSSGYVSPDLFVSQVLPVVNNSPNYGGLALWTRYYDEVSGFSTAIEISAMCTQQSDPKCKRSSHDDDDGFEQRFGSMSIDGFKVVYDGGNLGVQCCEMMCRKNCSCEAYAAVNEANKTGCQIWGKGSKFVEGHGGKGQAIYVVKHREPRTRIRFLGGQLLKKRLLFKLQSVAAIVPYSNNIDITEKQTGGGYGLSLVLELFSQYLLYATFAFPFGENIKKKVSIYLSSL
ncbi:G-type lectin S-receptor-like serine/threonine-protein kinase CES101 [Senna tora]|uniref:Acidic endochitinase n=1 Tax=Senna tora TaxID=362788 RepID=A0A834T2U8_9FABA|nr:G-type lectin S-receptor-like serine/threonine-protein kinase CES101 [Senna tora]